MNKISVLLLLLANALLAGAQQGFDFRASASFVTDPPGNVAVLPSTAYPMQASGMTYGWAKTYLVQGRDRSSAVDPRLAGINFASNGSPATFYVDLPLPGTYKLALAMGDEGRQQCWVACQVQFFDGSKLVGTVVRGVIDSGHFCDAQGTAWSDQSWCSSNVMLEVTLTGTRLTMVVGTDLPTGDFTTIAYLGIMPEEKPNFSLASTFAVKQGKQISFPVNLSASGGFNAPIALSAINVPNGLTVSFDPQILSAPGSATMTIAAQSDAPTGFHPLVVIGDGGSLEQTALVALTVTQ